MGSSKPMSVAGKMSLDVASLTDFEAGLLAMLRRDDRQNFAITLSREGLQFRVAESALCTGAKIRSGAGDSFEHAWRELPA